MKKVLSVFMMFVLLTTVFSGSLVVAAPGKTVTLTGEIVKVNPGIPYNKDMLALKTANKNYILNGKLTTQMGKYLNYTVSVKGTAYTGPQGISMFNATSFKIVRKAISTPEPSPSSAPVITQTPSEAVNSIQLTGTLYNVDSSKIRFLLKTEKGPYELMGNTSGMENEFGKTLVVTGNYVYTLVATEYPLFSVVSYKVIETPTAAPSPTPIPSSTVKTITIDDNGGYAYINKGDELQLILESNATTGYSWNYLEKPDPMVLVETNHEYRPENTSANIVGAGGIDVWTYKAVGSGTAIINLVYSRVWESVPPAKTFVIKVIVNESTTPVPSPNFEVIKGTLVVSKNPVIYEKIDNEPVPSDLSILYSFQLKTEKGLVTLNGNTAGLEKYNGYTVEAYGQYSLLTIYPPIFVVSSYKIIGSSPTPTAQVVLKGTLTVTRMADTDVSGYKFELKTDSGPVTLQGNTKGMENYNGSTIEVTGTYSPLKIYPPIFLVESYKIIEPTPVPASKDHTIISDKPLYFSDPKIGSTGTVDTAISGYSTISWTEGTDKAFFKAKIKAFGSQYEFELVAAKTTDSESIKGIFNIKKNGETVAKEIPGQLYGLSQPIGSYFKFYTDDMQWHLSAYIINRLDF